MKPGRSLRLRGLQSAAGFLQAKIAERIDIRYTPKLSFLLDQGVKRSIAVAEILQQVLPKENGAGRRGSRRRRRDGRACRPAGPTAGTAPDERRRQPSHEPSL